MSDRPSPDASLSRRASLGLIAGALAASVARAAEPVGWDAVDRAGAASIAEHLEPGFSISVMKNGAFVYSKGFGLANLETQTPMTSHHVLRVGSVTKQFTAAALMQLSEAGKVSVDDKLSLYIPEFPRANEVTLRQMLTHTSGIGNYTDRVHPQDFLRDARFDYASPELLKAMIAQTQPTFVFEPGTSWAYCNTAYVLLGLIIEKLTGEPYNAVFKQRLFDPAGLTRTAVDDLAPVVPDRASGYTHHAGSSADFDNADYISMTYPGAAGSMRSTTEDLCRWHLALFGGKIVKPASLAEMVKPALLKTGQLPTAPGGKSPLKYGFGLSPSEFEGKTRISHDGGIFGFTSILQSFPDQKVTVAAIMNFDGGGRPSSMPRLHAIVDLAARAALA